jgi:hypothetical protein
MSPEQQEYMAYHSPEQRAIRLAEARKANDQAVAEAHQLFFSGDVQAASDRLFSAGIPDEGISHYLACWAGNEHRL